MRKIDSNGYSVFLSSLSKSNFLGIGIFYLYVVGKTTSLFCMLIGTLLSLFYFFLITKFISMHPELTFKEKLDKAFGKILGTIVLCLFLVLTLISAILICYSLISFLSSQYLKQTPTVMLCALIWSLVIYINFKNIETLSRFSILTFWICVALYVFNFATLLPTAELSNFKPMFTISVMDIIKTSVVHSILLFGPCIPICMIKKNEVVDPEKLTKKLFRNYIGSAIILIAIVAIVLGSLGINMSILFAYPTFMVLTRISLFNFIDSIENIAVLLMFLYMIISASYMFMNIKDSIADFFKVKSPKIKYVITGVLGLLSFVAINILLYGKYTGEQTTLSFVKYPIMVYCLSFFIIFIATVIFFIKKFINKQKQG